MTGTTQTTTSLSSGKNHTGIPVTPQTKAVDLCTPQQLLCKSILSIQNSKKSNKSEASVLSSLQETFFFFTKKNYKPVGDAFDELNALTAEIVSLKATLNLNDKSYSVERDKGIGRMALKEKIVNSERKKSFTIKSEIEAFKQEQQNLKEMKEELQKKLHAIRNEKDTRNKELVEKMRIKNDVLMESNRELTMARNTANEKVCELKKQIQIATGDLNDTNAKIAQKSENEKRLALDVQKCKNEMDTLNHGYAQLQQTFIYVFKYFPSSIPLTLLAKKKKKKETVEELRIKLAKQKMASKLQPVYYQTQKMGEMVESIKKEQAGQMDDLFRHITTLFMSTVKKAEALRFVCVCVYMFVYNKAQRAIQSYRHEVSLRRKYFNVIQETKGNIRVLCRIRPLSEREIACGGALSIEFLNERKLRVQNAEENSASYPLVAFHNTLQIRNKIRHKTIEFDQVFEPNATQEEVFGAVKDLITSVLDGYNATIVTLGQSGSGKTYTMEGSAYNRGVVFRAVEELFRVIKDRQENFAYSVKLSLFEIDKENVRDLLTNRTLWNDMSPNTKSHWAFQHTDKSESSGFNSFAKQDCFDIEDVMRAIETTAQNRRNGTHTIFSIEVIGVNHVINCQSFGKLHLIDLAGCNPMLLNTNPTEDCMDETCSHDRTVPALFDVLTAICRRNTDIPYQTSKLTSLLKDSLGSSLFLFCFLFVFSCSWCNLYSSHFACEHVLLGRTTKKEDNQKLWYLSISRQIQRILKTQFCHCN
ncbi:hypothetical protein RFI_08928 [Reticulomyxa filosa]|uniref:Kinesin motor domain-containing protein n=2 Tax=Reticulomyxa filosa TaxID=46433 RepID=X6NQA4_RETFI|nr:hypothetical protein RFI_08928 [Reticulomyxa filosa]|eukprot:ETO28206.1 hypothetical protein RFI_08928 [Reticulomyxa filosa]